jgi:hypothetical protein
VGPGKSFSVCIGQADFENDCTRVFLIYLPILKIIYSSRGWHRNLPCWRFNYSGPAANDWCGHRSGCYSILSVEIWSRFKLAGERTLKFLNRDYTFREFFEVLCDHNNTQYETLVFPVSDARKQQESARVAESTDLELGFSSKSLFSSYCMVVPKPWQSDKFTFKPKDLRVMIRGCIWKVVWCLICLFHYEL